MPASTPDGVPGVSEAEIVGAVASLVTKTPATDLDDSDRFCIGVRSLVEMRAQGGWCGESSDDVGVFVLTPYPRPIGERLGAVPISNPVATAEPLLGRILFLNRDASTGRVMTMPVAPDAILEWLEDQGLGSSTVVMVYREKSLIINRRSGVSGDSSTDSLRNSATPVTPEEVIKALQHSHRTQLLTPVACPPGVWEMHRSAEYIPGPKPEKTIQKQMQTVFNSWFHGAIVADIEDTTTIGRIDIRLLRVNLNNRLEYWMIVELKVVKSLTHAPAGKKAKAVTFATNVEAVCEGVRQSFAFAQNKKASAMLEIFDLRKDKAKDILSEKQVFDELAKCTPKPLCHVWPLYGSSSDARIAGWY